MVIYNYSSATGCCNAYFDRNFTKIFQIDISCHEYCKYREEREIDGVVVYVYPIDLILIEKIRAICQQLPKYKKYVPQPSRSPRAKDFFDIYNN